MKVGIPRALLIYHKFFALWENFFKDLGIEVVLSSPTNKQILEVGCKLAVDESCLPIKVFIGHVWDLINNKKQIKLNWLFVPRIIATVPWTHYCPKFVGLPDMIKTIFPNLPPIIDVVFNLHRQTVPKVLINIGKCIFKNPFKKLKLRQVVEAAYQKYQIYVKQKEKKIDKPTILIIAHPYNLYDSYINANIIEKIRNYGWDVVTNDQLSIKNPELDFPQYWSFAKEFIGALRWAISHPLVKGVINIVSFSCGPDSLLSEILAQEAKENSFPHLRLLLDEHTSPVGIITRLEAFLSLIER